MFHVGKEIVPKECPQPTRSGGVGTGTAPLIIILIVVCNITSEFLNGVDRFSLLEPIHC